MAGALDVLPTLPLDDEADQQRATGTTDNVACAFAPMLAPNLGNHSTPGTTADKSALCAARGQSAVSVDSKQTPSSPKAGDATRTRNNQLGRLMLYQLSYARNDNALQTKDL